MYKLQRLLTPFFILLIGCVLFFGITVFLESHLLPNYEKQSLQTKQALLGMMASNNNNDLNQLSLLTDNQELRNILKSKKFKESQKQFEDISSSKNKELTEKPLFVTLLDRKGDVMLSSGDIPKFGKNWSGLPVFLEAKGGILRDGVVQNLKKESLHVFAAPIYENNEVYVLLFGWRFTDLLVEQLSTGISAPVIVIEPGKNEIIKGKAFANLSSEVLQGSTQQNLGETELDLILPVPGLPLFISDTGRYLLANEKPWGAKNTPYFVYGVDRLPTFQLIGNTQILVLFLSILFAFIMAILLNIWSSSVDKPLKKLTEQLSSMATGGKISVLAENGLTGPVKRLSRQLNLILQNSSISKGGILGQSGVSTKAPAFPLDATGAISPALDESSLSSSSKNIDSHVPQEFDMIGSQQLHHPEASAAESPLATSENKSQPFGFAPVSAEFKKSSLAGLFSAAGDPILAKDLEQNGLIQDEMPSISGINEQSPNSFPDMSLPGKMSSQPERPTLIPTPSNHLSQISSEELSLPGQNLDGNNTAYSTPTNFLQEMSSDLSSPEAMHMLPNRFGSLEEEDDDDMDERTVIAAIPTDLLKETARSSPAPFAPPVDPVQAHFRETYDRFIKLRIECGEDVSQLNYERFETKLKKNREQIIQKYNPKSVRFQVYEKSGKAALRAVPVRD